MNVWVYDAHLGELRRGATGDLLHPETEELMLELSQLLCQVVLRPVSVCAINKPNFHEILRNQRT